MVKEKLQVSKCLEEAVSNIRSDRDVTQALLVQAMEIVASNKAEHKFVGPVLAKYLETMQRSNEQLVKIAIILRKDSTEDMELSDSDKEELYDTIQNEK